MHRHTQCLYPFYAAWLASLYRVSINTHISNRRNFHTLICSLCSLMSLFVCVWFHLYPVYTEEKWLNGLQMNKYHHINYFGKEEEDGKTCNHYTFQKASSSAVSLSFGFTELVHMKEREREIEAWKRKSSEFVTGTKGKMLGFLFYFSACRSIEHWCEIFGCTETISGECSRLKLSQG